MGASFCVYEEIRDSVSIGYHGVMHLRLLLLDILGLRQLYEQATHYAIKDEEKAECDKAWVKLNDELDLESQASDIVRGIKMFVIHSDCDGEFSAEESQYIGKAFSYFNDHTEYHANVHEHYLDVMRELGDLFVYAGEKNGIVKIF